MAVDEEDDDKYNTNDEIAPARGEGEGAGGRNKIPH